MKLKYSLGGFITGTLLSTGIGSAVNYHSVNKISEEYEERLEQELRKNLSKNVLKAEIVQSPPSTEYLLPENIANDKALIMIYAEGINGHDYKLPLFTTEYFKFKQMPHQKNGRAYLVNWVTYNNQAIKSFADAMTKDLVPEKKAQVLLDFVHQQIYDLRIEENEDYVRYPLETLVERNGDCEDLAILGLALMKSIGLDVALVGFPPKSGEKYGHVGIGVNGNFSGSYFNIYGKKYFYAESTGTVWLNQQSNWKIGDMPPDFAAKAAEIYIIN